MKLRSLIVVSLLCAGSAADAGDPIAPLGWLEGHWQTEAFGGVVEEIWLPAAGNAMHGVFRLTVDGKLVFSEFMQVTAEADQVIMRFEHFQPDYSTWEGEGPPMELKVSEATPERLVFEAANDESPGRIAYQRVGEELHVTVTGVDDVLRFQRRR